MSPIPWRDWAIIVIAVTLVLLCAWQIADYTQFRQAGARFTAADGAELCESHQALAYHVGYTGPLPACDYPSRRR